MAARLRERYQQEIHPTLLREFEYKNPMQVPKVEKVVVNIGLGEALQNARALDSATADVAAITGQKPVITVTSFTALSNALAFCSASPMPMLTTIFFNSGTCMTLP